MGATTFPKDALPGDAAEEKGPIARREIFSPDTGAFIEIVEEERVAACLVGPGNGINVATRERTLAALRQKLPVVLDADAISVFEETRELLFDSIQSPCLMTPHEGEFSRLFDFTGDKVSRVREAAARSGSTILLKGGDTVTEVSEPSSK